MDIVEFFLSDVGILLILLWILPWKGVAMWNAARRNEKKWFVAFLILNTLAILEIIYLFVVIKRAPKDKFSPDDTRKEEEPDRESAADIFQR